jgi:hypothetical protein
MFSVISNAQNIMSDGTHFLESVKTKNWNNANANGITEAAFSSFDGSCYVNLEVDENAEVHFETITNIKSGSIEILLMDETDQTYFYCNTSKHCENHKVISLKKGKKYRLYFTGKKAKGNYKVKWKI